MNTTVAERGLSHGSRITDRLRDSSRLIIATLATGVLAGIGAIGFHYLSDALGGFLGHFFIRMFNRIPKMFPRRWPLAARVALGGFLVGTIGIWFPQVLSDGYPTIEQGLQGNFAVSLFIALLGLKMLATSITFGSGAVGGLFAPTLVIGAMYGGAFGYGFQHLMPSAVPQPELFVLLGMVVMFGSIVKGYWSGLLLVADMSGCYHQLLLPGVIAGGISFVLSWKLHDRSIFGLPLDPGREPEHAADTKFASVPEPTFR